jgi:hypothetical protein
MININSIYELQMSISNLCQMWFAVSVSALQKQLRAHCKVNVDGDPQEICNLENIRPDKKDGTL